MVHFASQIKTRDHSLWPWLISLPMQIKVFFLTQESPKGDFNWTTEGDFFWGEGPALRAQAAGSWLGTKNALYYCAQSAHSFSWVLFVSSYTTAIVSITACLARAPNKWPKNCTQSGNFQFDIKFPSDFKILSARKLKTLFQKDKLELTTGIHACIGHVLRKY